jgi:uncharacterized protein (TIGR02653 family)
MSDLDELDQLASQVFDGYLVRKDLARQFGQQYPVPTYVAEFLLGRYCATTDPDEIVAGLEMVQKQMQERTVRAGEQELFKHRAREAGKVKIIDLLKARLDAKNDSYKAELPSLQLNDIHIASTLVDQHQRMLTGGFYAEVTLEYLAALAGEQGGQPFRIEAIRPIQVSTHDALGEFQAGRQSFTLGQWRNLLLRSVGFEPSKFTARQQDVLLLRMVPFAISNYNAVELGPRGTGKSHLFQQISPYSHLVSGGRASVANMFVNNTNQRRGLVAQYDVICFDEISGVSFDDKSGVNILKGYMESGEFSRGGPSIKAEGGIVMVGNFDVDVDTQLKVGHLLAPLPREMRDDTAFMDRIHAYVPGWDVPKFDPSYFTDQFGFVSDFLAEVWSQSRRAPRLEVTQGRLEWGSSLSGRDRKAVNNTIDGLLRLLYPDPEMDVPDEFLAWAAELALESRRRVKEAQALIGAAEFGKTDLSYSVGGAPQKVVYCDESLRHRAGQDVRAAGGHPAGGAQEDDPLPTPDPKGTVSPPIRDYSVGDTIGERFKVLAVLGSGGFSRVYRVLDSFEEREFALKLFDADGYAAARREIGALRAVSHPNVVKVEWANKTQEGEWYLVTEFIDGEPLTEYASGVKHLRDREAVDVALDVLKALVAIHPREGSDDTEKFLVHRDIKPQNIMMTRAGAKLLDFNIASRVGDPVNTMAGTPPYQPPDGVVAKWDVSPDLFALGVTLYELLCNGEHPYENARPMLDTVPIDPREVRSDLNNDLAEFLVKACSPEREDRFQTAAEMKSSLEAVRADL